MSSRLVTLLVFATCMLAACGGDSEDSEGSGDFVAEADSICRSAVEEQVDLEIPPVDASQEEIIADFEERLDIRRSALEELESLDPPSDAADDYDAALAARREVISIMERELGLIEEGVTPDQPEYQEVLSENVAAFEEGEAAAEDAGLTDCANKLSPEDEEEVKRVVETFQIEPLDDCTDYATDAAIDDLFGGLEECQEAQESPPPEGFTEEVVFEDVGGNDELSAYADATLKGGFGDGEVVQFSLVYEDGTYKIDGVFQAPPE